MLTSHVMALGRNVAPVLFAACHEPIPPMVRIRAAEEGLGQGVESRVPGDRVSMAD